MELLGCTITDGLLQTWGERLVFPREPILVTEPERGLLPSGTLRYTWDELRADHNSVPLDLWDSYVLYGVRREGTEVALVSPRELRLIPEQARATLRLRQWERGRGQFYKPESAPGVRVDTPDGPRNLLHHDTWVPLPWKDKRRILLDFAAQDNDPSIPYSGEDPIVRMLANTFVGRSGPNCFATVLAAVTPSLEMAASISELWLHPEPFLRGLTERGFSACAWSGEHEPGTVLVWYDGKGRPQHTCYLLADGSALNKNAQAWFRPRQTLPIKRILAEWEDEGLSIRQFVRE